MTTTIKPTTDYTAASKSRVSTPNMAFQFWDFDPSAANSGGAWSCLVVSTSGFASVNDAVDANCTLVRKADYTTGVQVSIDRNNGSLWPFLPSTMFNAAGANQYGLLFVFHDPAPSAGMPADFFQQAIFGPNGVPFLTAAPTEVPEDYIFQEGPGKWPPQYDDIKRTRMLTQSLFAREAVWALLTDSERELATRLFRSSKPGPRK